MEIDTAGDDDGDADIADGGTTITGDEHRRDVEHDDHQQQHDAELLDNADGVLGVGELLRIGDGDHTRVRWDPVEHALWKAELFSQVLDHRGEIERDLAVLGADRLAGVAFQDVDERGVRHPVCFPPHLLHLR